MDILIRGGFKWVQYKVSFEGKYMMMCRLGLKSIIELCTWISMNKLHTSE